MSGTYIYISNIGVISIIMLKASPSLFKETYAYIGGQKVGNLKPTGVRGLELYCTRRILSE